MKNVFSGFLATALAVVALFPISSAARVGTASFTGIVDHVSSNNIKVTNTKSQQSLSFLILPKFDQVFSSDGKTTYQMSKIKAGQYVKVYYDQKAMGARHADRILLLTQRNTVKAKE